MPAGNDFCNNYLFNMVLHWVDDDEGRGLPEYGKLVFDNRDLSVYVCTDIFPDEEKNGGGVWERIGGAGGGSGTWTSVQPRIWQNNTLISINTGTSVHEYVVDGEEIRGWFKIFVTGSGTAGHEVRIRLPPYGGNDTSNAFIVGHGSWWNGSVYQNVELWTENTDSGPVGYNGISFRMIVNNTPGSLGTNPSTALANGHELHGQYLIRGTANGNTTT
jgi:hypothetical protein